MSRFLFCTHPYISFFTGFVLVPHVHLASNTVEFTSMLIVRQPTSGRSRNNDYTKQKLRF